MEKKEIKTKYCLICPGKSGTSSFYQFCIDKGFTCDHGSGNMYILIVVCVRYK